MKSDIHITVSGPGSIINTELQLIEKMFAELGYSVSTINDYTPDRPVRDGFDIVAHSIEIKNIVLIADHQPWGG